MKKYACLVLVIAFLTTCKKESGKSLVQLVDRTVWTGELLYVFRLYPEAFCIEFNGVGGFTFHQLKGSGGGMYTLDEAARTITLDFTSGTITTPVTFEVDGNNKFANMTYAAGSKYKFLYGSLTEPYKQSLDNTTWAGTTSMSVGEVLYELTFKPLSKMSYGMYGNGHADDVLYQKNQASVNSSDMIFGIIKGDSMIGIQDHVASGFRPFRIAKK